MRYLASCVVSAILGAWFVTWMTAPKLSAEAAAQNARPTQGPQFPTAGESPATADASPKQPYDTQGLTLEESVNIAVYENVNRSVAHITTKSTRTDSFFFLEVPAEGTGSGSVLDKTGHILTNYHVIEGANEVVVTLFNGETHYARFIGADPINDIAVIKVDAPADQLYPVILADSSRLRVGMRVYAIGNPFGLERTLSTGIISSVNRSLQLHGNRTIKSIIQIDAAINPGNSGGPLLDSHGRLIGMNTAIASKVGQSSGVGFAIPVNLISRVVPQLIQHGKVIRPEIGLLRVFETDQGLRVERLTPNGPAEQAGIRGPRIVRQRRGPFVIERVDRSTADVISEVDGDPVKTADDFLSYIERKKPGEHVVLTIIRDGQELEIDVQLGGESNVRKPSESRI